MARFVSDNPTNNRNLTIVSAGYAVSSTATGAVINTGVDISALEKGQSIILVLTGGTAQGFTTLAEYFVIPNTSTSFYIASTKENALKGVILTGTTGNAGAGTVYPNYRVGGVVYVGTGGDLNCRGAGVSATGSTSFSLLKNVYDGASFPYMIKDICAMNTTCQDLVVWCD